MLTSKHRKTRRVSPSSWSLWHLIESSTLAMATCLYTPDFEDRGELIQLTLKIQIKKLDGRRLLLSPDGHDLIIPSTYEPQQHIVDAIGLAYRWA